MTPAPTLLLSTLAPAPHPSHGQGAVATARSVVAHDGIRGLYKGFGTVVCGMFPARMVSEAGQGGATHALQLWVAQLLLRTRVPLLHAEHAPSAANFAHLPTDLPELARGLQGCQRARAAPLPPRRHRGGGRGVVCGGRHGVAVLAGCGERFAPPSAAAAAAAAAAARATCTSMSPPTVPISCSWSAAVQCNDAYLLTR